MANENNFKETVNSLFKGMDSFISAKTVVGEAIHVGDTIILPLMLFRERRRITAAAEWQER